MPNVTLAIPEELHTKMKKHSEIRWSEIVRKTIAEKINDLELLDKLIRKSKFTQEDVEKTAHKINKDTLKDFNKK